MMRAMNTSAAPAPSRHALPVLVVCAGLAALSWELLWSHHATLALGASARGAAITLAATMGGMTVGAMAMGRFLRTRPIVHPARLYSALELVIGVCGLALPLAFDAIAIADAAIYRASPAAAPLVQLALIVLALGPAAAAMGATVPVFGLMARATRSDLSRLYAFNTFGAAIGVLGMAFWALSVFGVELTGVMVACVNFAVALAARILPVEAAPGNPIVEPVDSAPSTSGLSERARYAVVFATGFITFFLEVAWFRALRSALHATTDSFALILAAVLIPLALSARLVGPLRRRGAPFGALLVAAGVLVLLATPAIERFDMFVPLRGSYGAMIAGRFLWTLLLMGPAILALGVALPWLLDEAPGPRRWGRLYATNTLGAVVGSLLAGWVVLPAVGFTHAAWLAGGAIAVVGIAVMRGRARVIGGGVALASLAVAIGTSSGVGSTRIMDPSAVEGQTVVETREGPDATVSVIDSPRWGRVLVIDGFYATAETLSAHYMEWMGRLPMLVHEQPDDALVICFGTGQTANAVRREGAERLDVVDLSDAVIAMAHHFEMNEAVLDDPRVSVHVMDGRAWLRRTDRTYDVITLEPMPPNHAGVNALYSQEFYELAAVRMSPDGVIAQWLPFHLVTPHHSIAITRAFVDVFPNAMLWIDPVDRTGILVGRRDMSTPIAQSWPGLQRQVTGRTLEAAQVREAVRIAGADLLAYASLSEPVTDDNQLLAYLSTEDRRHKREYDEHEANLAVIEQVLEERAGGGLPAE